MSARILIVDDIPSYLDEAAEQLRAEGYEVACAGSGLEGLALLQREPFNAILLDLNMAGLSGGETCRRIKAQPALRDTPLLILTAQAEAQALADSIEAGADDYVTKSGDLAVLKARLKAQLRRRQFEDENRGFREQLLRQEMDAREWRGAQELAAKRAAHIV